VPAAGRRARSQSNEPRLEPGAEMDGLSWRTRAPPGSAAEVRSATKCVVCHGNWIAQAPRALTVPALREQRSASGLESRGGCLKGLVNSVNQSRRSGRPVGHGCDRTAEQRTGFARHDARRQSTSHDRRSISHRTPIHEKPRAAAAGQRVVASRPTYSAAGNRAALVRNRFAA
jgi:hypothetical protein